MGLSSGLSTRCQETSVSLSPAEAFAAITLVSVSADLSDEETLAMISSLSRMQ